MSKKSIEIVVFETHMSRWHKVDLKFWIILLFVAIVSSFFVIQLFQVDFIPSDFFQNLDWRIHIAVGAIDLILMLIILFRFWYVQFQRIAITETHLIKESGWIMKNRIELPLPFLANATVRTSDSLWGSFMGYATIRLDNMGGHADMEFVDIAKAKKFKEQLKEAMFKHRPSSIPGVPPTK